MCDEKRLFVGIVETCPSYGGLNVTFMEYFVRLFSIYDDVIEVNIIFVINYYFVLNVAKTLRF